MKIRKYLSITALKCIIHSFVTSRLDSNNALLYNILNFHLQKLQRVQSWAAKVILGGKKVPSRVSTSERTALAAYMYSETSPV